jgi:hypothetical protein
MVFSSLDLDLGECSMMNTTRLKDAETRKAQGMGQRDLGRRDPRDRQNIGSQETQLGHRSANGPRAMIGPSEILEEGCAHQTNREAHLKNYVRNHWNDGGLSVNWHGSNYDYPRMIPSQQE